METLSSSMKSRNSSNLSRSEFDRANIHEIPTCTTGADTKKINDNIFELTPEVYKALSSTS